MNKLLTVIITLIISLSAKGFMDVELGNYRLDYEREFAGGFIDIETSEKIEFIEIDGKIRYLNNDMENESFIVFSILKKIDDYFLVLAWNSFPGDYLGAGFVSVTAPIHIFLKHYPFEKEEITDYYGDIRLFNEPSYDSEYRVMKNPREAKIIDVCGKWLKIQYKEGDHIIEGWLSEFELCQNVYSTCC